MVSHETKLEEAEMSRYVTLEEAQREGFGTLFAIAMNYAKNMPAFDPEVEADELAAKCADAKEAPFPNAHKQRENFIWISGCHEGLKLRRQRLIGEAHEAQKRFVQEYSRRQRWAATFSHAVNLLAAARGLLVPALGDLFTEAHRMADVFMARADGDNHDGERLKGSTRSQVDGMARALSDQPSSFSDESDE